MSALLDVAGLTVAVETPHGPRTLVDGVDLTVRRGEVVALVGDSGSGKTVTTLALTDLFPRRTSAHVSGSAIYAGTQLVGAGEAVLRGVRGRHIAFVPQDASRTLDPLQTVGAHVAEAVRLAGCPRNEARTTMMTLLERVGFDDPDRVARLHPHQLSGGMRQRTLIAAALAGTPSLLIADEPTSALDVLAQTDLLDLIDQLRRDDDMACIIVTHDFGVVARLADTVAVMDAGRIVETGPATTILATPSHPTTRRLIDAVPRIHLDRGPSRLPRVEPSEPSEPSGPLVQIRKAEVVFSSARKSRGHAGLDGVDLDLDAGHAIGIVGPSGCGKTTLARVVCALQPLTAGSISSPGAGRPRRGRVQLVFQEPLAALDPRQTVDATLDEALRLHGIVDTAERLARAAQLCTRVGLDPLLGGRRAHQLSGGQRQRVVIARALSSEPDVLVLDEPVSSLDVSVRADLLELFQRLRTEGVALMMISHDLAMVANLVDTVHVMDAGRIIETGTPSDIFERPHHPLTRRLVEAASTTTRTGRATDTKAFAITNPNEMRSHAAEATRADLERSA